MKKTILFMGLMAFFISCEERTERPENSRGIPGPEKVKALAPNIDTQEKNLKEKGYETFRYQEGDTTYLMQQYFLVLLKTGPNRSQDSVEAAELQEKHLAHLSKLAKEGHISLAGPLGDDGEIRGIVIYNTPTQREADSLARIDPMVQAGRLEVEVHPWWAAKGGKLN